ncbi:putative ABC transporter ATP-binding protein TM_0288 [Arthrobacter sp. Bi83]|nr:putative ABC transporter ATP-binding protein TM_0288 [Arthrobacter sp. Bi83]
MHSLPKGYDTVPEDEGTNVSAGEKQLVTIACAFLAGPSVLILNEATSTHASLLVAGEAYSALYAAQFAAPVAEVWGRLGDQYCQVEL